MRFEAGFAVLLKQLPGDHLPAHRGRPAPADARHHGTAGQHLPARRSGRRLVLTGQQRLVGRQPVGPEHNPVHQVDVPPYLSP